jgi:hypothetical protein
MIPGRKTQLIELAREGDLEALQDYNLEFYLLEQERKAKCLSPLITKPTTPAPTA